MKAKLEELYLCFRRIFEAIGSFSGVHHLENRFSSREALRAIGIESSQNSSIIKITKKNV